MNVKIQWTTLIMYNVLRIVLCAHIVVQWNTNICIRQLSKSYGRILF